MEPDAEPPPAKTKPTKVIRPATLAHAPEPPDPIPNVRLSKKAREAMEAMETRDGPSLRNAETPAKKAKSSKSSKGRFSVDDLAEFDRLSPRLQAFVRDAIDLGQRGLRYRFGSADPRSGGLDCSGAVHYLLSKHGFNPPRQANTQYDWLKNSGTIHRVASSSPDSSDFNAIKPGDLVFWTGTYRTDRWITHVMIYLGTERETGRRMMAGAASQRSGRGVKIDELWTPQGGRSRLVAYGSIPGLDIDPKKFAKKRKSRARDDDDSSSDDGPAIDTEQEAKKGLFSRLFSRRD